MKYRSVFDIIGPVMIGPSSSHTAGAVRLGQLARKLFGREPDQAEIHFYGSFAETYKGHATDVAVIAGILGLQTDDARIGDSLSLAEKQGIKLDFICEEAIPVHPNTLKVVLKKSGDRIEMTGVSIGGGAVQVVEFNGFLLKLSGDYPSILILHKDVYGTIASVTAILAGYRINISGMEVSRHEKGQEALMVIEMDQPIPSKAVREIESSAYILKVVVLD